MKPEHHGITGWLEIGMWNDGPIGEQTEEDQDGADEMKRN